MNCINSSQGKILNGQQISEKVSNIPNPQGTINYNSFDVSSHSALLPRKPTINTSEGVRERAIF